MHSITEIKIQQMSREGSIRVIYLKFKNITSNNIDFISIYVEEEEV